MIMSEDQQFVVFVAQDKITTFKLRDILNGFHKHHRKI